RAHRLRGSARHRGADGVRPLAGALRRHHLLRSQRMKRLLALVMPGQEASALAALPALVATARGDAARIRIACICPLPPAREDRHGYVVADTDREMARITRTLEETFAAATRV